MAEVRLLAGLRDTLGGGQRRLALPAASVGELLHTLVAQSSDRSRARQALLPDEALHPDLQVLVNGRNIDLLDYDHGVILISSGKRLNWLNPVQP